MRGITEDGERVRPLKWDYAEKTPSLFRMPSFSVFSNSLSLRGFRDDGVVSYVHVSHEKGIAYE